MFAESVEHEIYNTNKTYDKNICIDFRDMGCFGFHLDQGCLYFLMTTLCSLKLNSLTV